MKKAIIIFFFTHFVSSISAQIQRVVDSTSNKGIPYVAVAFGNNNGLYTDSKGEFNLADVTKDSIFLSSIGYKEKRIDLNSIKNNTIYLSPSNYELAEVIISNKVRKSKTKKIKPIKHNDFLKSQKLIIGGELAIYIANSYNSDDIELKSLLIPIVTKTISFDESMDGKAQRVKRLPFSALYKISFYENTEGKPGELLNYEYITVVLNEKSKVVNLNLEKYYITLPSEGFFVGILNLGKTDEQGKLISTTPYKFKKIKNRVVKFVTPTKPYFPINYKENENFTFYRFIFSENNEWELFYRQGKVKDGEYHNISLGYELKIY